MYFAIILGRLEYCLMAGADGLLGPLMRNCCRQFPSNSIIIGVGRQWAAVMTKMISVAGHCKLIQSRPKYVVSTLYFACQSHVITTGFLLLLTAVVALFELYDPLECFDQEHSHTQAAICTQKVVAPFP